MPVRGGIAYRLAIVNHRLLRLPALLVVLALTCVPVVKMSALITAPLVPPSHLAVSYVAHGKVALTWEPSTGPLVYYVIRSANGGPWQQIGITGLNRFEDQLPPAGTSYTYGVYGEERNSVGSRFTAPIYVASRVALGAEPNGASL
jgi:hypothetical protein